MSTPYSEVTGVNLPSSLTTLLPVGLRIFFLPTCVGLRYGHLRYTRSFSRLLSSRTSVLIFPSISTRTNTWLRPSKSVPALKFSVGTEYSPTSVHRLRLGLTLAPPPTWSGRTFLQKPEVSGHDDSHIIRATHSGILTSVTTNIAYAIVSPLTQRSPTPHKVCSLSFGLYLSPVKFSAQRRSTSELLRTFK